MGCRRDFRNSTAWRTSNSCQFLSVNVGLWRLFGRQLATNAVRVRITSSTTNADDNVRRVSSGFMPLVGVDMCVLTIPLVTACRRPRASSRTWRISCRQFATKRSASHDDTTQLLQNLNDRLLGRCFPDSCVHFTRLDMRKAKTPHKKT